MPEAILDPTGRAAKRTARLAPRRADLRGATVGLLENGKHNAALFLEELGRLLVERHGAARVVVGGKTNLLPAPDELVARLARECDVVVTGVGDCGSCSASGVADALCFERHGVPAALICSDAFTATADAMAGLQGSPGYRYVTTAHPVAVLDPDEVRDRALAALPEVTAILLAG